MVAQTYTTTKRASGINQALVFGRKGGGQLLQALSFNLVGERLLVQAIGLLLQFALAVRQRIAHAQHELQEQIGRAHV